jgi:hypothetical protein
MTRKMVFALILVMGRFALAEGSCSNEQLLAAIQTSCGQYDLTIDGEIQYSEGEYDADYSVPITNNTDRKVMEVVILNGGLVCSPDNIEVQGTCP